MEKEAFLDIVLGAPPHHFMPSDLPLVAAYARAIVQEKIAAGELARAYVVDDKPSPWLPVWQASIRAVTTLARMLALSPGGRVPSKSPEAQEPISYYSRLALEANAMNKTDMAALSLAIEAQRKESPSQCQRIDDRLA